MYISKMMGYDGNIYIYIYIYIYVYIYNAWFLNRPTGNPKYYQTMHMRIQCTFRALIRTRRTAYTYTHIHVYIYTVSRRQNTCRVISVLPR